MNRPNPIIVTVTGLLGSLIYFAGIAIVLGLLNATCAAIL